MDIQTITMWPDFLRMLQTLCESTNFDDFMEERLTTFLKSLVEELSKKKISEKSDNDEKIDNDKKKKRKVSFVLPEAKRNRRANSALTDLDCEKSSGSVSSDSCSSDSGSVSNCMPDVPTGSVSGSTPIFAVSESSGSFCIKIRKPKATEMKKRATNIRLHMTLLVHACACKNRKCPSTICAKMKALLHHGANCKIRATNGCPTCKRIWALLQIHARQCLAQHGCPVSIFFCAFLVHLGVTRDTI